MADAADTIDGFRLADTVESRSEAIALREARATVERMAEALQNCRDSLHWYARNAEGNSPDKPDPDDVENVAAADAALAEYKGGAA